MTASKLPVGLPRPNPTKAYWQTPPLPIADHRTTPNLPSSSEFVIIGSGITGATIAYKLLSEQPNASILMLEARQASSGATGRNGGHCRAGRYLEFASDLEHFGEEDALLMEKLEEDNVQNVAKLIKDLGIECDLREVETVDIWTDDQKGWDEALESLKKRKEVLKGKIEEAVLMKHKVWGKEEARRGLMIPEAVGAVSFPAYALSPYKFVCGLLEILLKKGINLQTSTPVVEVSQMKTRRGKKKWVVHTERGEVYAEKVILATNAYTPALYPALAEFIIPTRAQVAAVRPGSKIAGNPALMRTCGLNSAISGDYMQTRAEEFSGAGDVIIGGGRKLGTNGEQPILDDTTIHPNISKYLTHAAARYFGHENWGRNGETLQEWTGIMGYTVDKQPIIGEAPGQEGLWICVGFNGHGMALAFQSAEALVQLLTGKEKQVDEWLPKCYRLLRVPKSER